MRGRERESFRISMRYKMLREYYEYITKYDILYIHPSVKLDIIEPQLHLILFKEYDS